MENRYVINPEKQECISLPLPAGRRCYRRLGVRTHVLTAADSLPRVAARYAGPLLLPGDLLFISEKAAACTQGRAIPLEAIHPRPLARLLCKFVLRTPYGIGLAMPETMEMALQECGVPRILLAAALSAVGKALGRRGWFYRAAGYRAASIDGPCAFPLPPYNRCVVLGPLAPDSLAEEVSRAVGAPTAIVDINDLGGEILGAFPPQLDRELLKAALRDNPLGQSGQQTPMGILRRA